MTVQRVLEKINYYSKAQQRYISILMDAIVHHYGRRLLSLAVFGSFARGTHKSNSDLDILILLDDGHAQSVSKRLQEFTTIELSLLDAEDDCVKTDVEMDLSPVILSAREAEHFNPLYLDMTEDCLILIDRENFLQRILDSVREKKSRWGSQKISIANQWYWNIKPGLSWGERIDYDQ